MGRSRRPANGRPRNRLTPPTVEITGVAAAIEWSYYVAATVGGFVARRDRDTKTWSVEGVITSADPFKLAQQPLTFIVPHKTGALRWPILDPIHPAAGPFYARLGQPEG